MGAAYDGRPVGCKAYTQRMEKNGIVADGKRRLEAGEKGEAPPQSLLGRVLGILGWGTRPDKRVF